MGAAAEARKQAEEIMSGWSEGWSAYERSVNLYDLRDRIARALAEKDAALVEARAHSDGADEAAAEALRQRDDARAKLAEAERERDEAMSMHRKTHEAMVERSTLIGLLERERNEALGKLAALEADLAAMRAEIFEHQDFLRWASGMNPAHWDALPEAVRGRWKVLMTQAPAESPGAAWLATAREVVEALEREAGSNITGCHLPHDEGHRGQCVTCALLARPEVQQLKGTGRKKEVPD